MTDINKLKELAVRALPFAPGEWFVENGIDQVRDCANDFVCETGEDEPIKASFIAAANPNTILALLDEIDQLKAENCAHKDTQKHCELLEQYLKECASALPGTYYMDPPDGGNVSIPEQIRRMAKDAARYRWLIASAWYVGPEPKGDTEAVSWHDHNDTMHGVTTAIDAA
ncbi:TPA: ead/Ea22-like family protein, partial [Pseudomonas aeruginosa]|nr:ead/Ea22-like family protein [Pseudomonas aeruginosa]